MSNFGLYAAYYDLLYSDKDYAGETGYVNQLIRQHTGPGNIRLLDLGCGTGKHDFLLASHDYTVTGVDLSAQMIHEANETRNQNFPDAPVEFTEGDARAFRNGRQYDAVISLFHVASYQIGNEDLLNMLRTAKIHLVEGGIFVFDCWYGPGVLTSRPVNRVKDLENADIKVKRIARPEMYPNQNLVDVNYEVNIADKKTGETQTIHEKHTMRYLFLPEMLHYLQHTGFELLQCFEWMTRKEPDFDSWNVVFICKSSKHA